MKKRLTGAIVLVALVVIFVPMLLEDKSSRIELGPLIPQEPKENFSTTMIPDEQVTTIAEPVDSSEIQRYELPVGEVMDKPAGSPAAPGEEIMVPTEVIKPATPPVVVAPPPPPVVAPPPVSAAPVSGAVVSSGWVIQAGSFGQRSNAEKLRQKLIASGRPSFIEPVEVQGKTLYRVRVGPLEQRAEAERQLAVIEKEFKLKGKVLSFP